MGSHETHEIPQQSKPLQLILSTVLFKKRFAFNTFQILTQTKDIC